MDAPRQWSHSITEMFWEDKKKRYRNRFALINLVAGESNSVAANRQQPSLDERAITDMF